MSSPSSPSAGPALRHQQLHQADEGLQLLLHGSWLLPSYQYLKKWILVTQPPLGSPITTSLLLSPSSLVSCGATLGTTWWWPAHAHGLSLTCPDHQAVYHGGLERVSYLVGMVSCISLYGASIYSFCQSTGDGLSLGRPQGGTFHNC